MASNRVIGADGRLPWHLSSDLKRFRALTMGHHIILGRKTYESIGKPLPGRKTIVLTRNRDFVAPECAIVHSLDEAIHQAQGDSEVFVVGGAELYRQALNRVDRLYLTEVRAELSGDTLFPKIDLSDWRCVQRTEYPAGERDDYPHSFSIYDRLHSSPP